MASRPPVRQPERRPVVAVVFYEGQELAVGHGTRSELEGLDEDTVARLFAVEGKILSGVPDPAQRLFAAEPSMGRSFRRSRVRTFEVGRLKWIVGEHVLQVSEHQLLVLLLVVQPQLDRESELRIQVRSLGEQRRHVAVHMVAVGENLLQGRSRQQTASGSRIRLAQALVIGVEENPVFRVIGAVARQGRLEHQGLEEPARVRQMTLHRAGLLHRLNRAVLGGQRLRQPQGSIPDTVEDGPEVDLGARGRGAWEVGG